MKKFIVAALSLAFSVIALGQSYPSPTYNNVAINGTATIPHAAITGGTISGLSPPIPVASGGTNSASASGTALDNITGFASTGFMSRTGAGTYSFTASTGSGSVVLAASPTIASPTVTGSFTATGLVTLADHATQAANTIIGNGTGSTASPTALAVPSCSATTNALTWTSSTGFTCNSSINAATLGGATFAAPGPIGSSTPSTGAFTTVNSAGPNVAGGNITAAYTSPGAYIAARTQSTSIGNQIYNTVTNGGGTDFDATESTVVIPNGSTLTGVNGFGSYVVNQNPASAGSRNGVNYFSVQTCAVNNGGCWAQNAILQDNTTYNTSSFTGINMIGAEYDLTATSTGTNIQGISLLGSSLVQPAGADGFTVGSLSTQNPGVATWSHSFVSSNGSSNVALYGGMLGGTSGNNLASQPIQLAYTNGSGTAYNWTLQALTNGAFNITDGAGATAHSINLNSNVNITAAAQTGANVASDNLLLNYRDASATAQDYQIAVGANQVLSFQSSAGNASAKYFFGGLIQPVSSIGIQGTTAGDNAQAGSIGEHPSSSVSSGSAVALTTATPANITSLSLSAGDWQVCGSIATNPNASTIQTVIEGGVSATSATLPPVTSGALALLNLTFATGAGQSFPVGCTRANITATTTYYLVMLSNFSGSTNSGYGTIWATRMR
ncbi:beta strand repeat-containing protein [Burkholderia pseudomultivorans]|uniref:beta strand repeat-containing protein n=1 Tax=Burkholderia pseudomultivorans TaxID=1207504 RepID=UPI0012DB0718|nr:hypothetical protein [Burkholderia pseudomultivorans]